jgi:hypothetical protein
MEAKAGYRNEDFRVEKSERRWITGETRRSQGAEERKTN